MCPDQISNPRPLVLESDALPTALRGPTKRSGRLHLRQQLDTSSLTLRTFTAIKVLQFSRSEEVTEII